MEVDSLSNDIAVTCHDRAAVRSGDERVAFARSRVGDRWRIAFIGGTARDDEGANDFNDGGYDDEANDPFIVRREFGFEIVTQEFRRSAAQKSEQRQTACPNGVWQPTARAFG